MEGTVRKYYGYI